MTCNQNQAYEFDFLAHAGIEETQAGKCQEYLLGHRHEQESEKASSKEAQNNRSHLAMSPQTSNHRGSDWLGVIYSHIISMRRFCQLELSDTSVFEGNKVMMASKVWVK